MSGEFEKIIENDREYDDTLLLPLMQDPRIGQAVLFEAVPELGHEVDLDALIKQVAADHQIDEGLVRAAYERAKGKFERIQEYGY